MESSLICTGKERRDSLFAFPKSNTHEKHLIYKNFFFPKDGKVTEQDETKSSPWYRQMVQTMIRRFVKSREFESPFALLMLHNILNQVLEKPAADKANGAMDFVSPFGKLEKPTAGYDNCKTETEADGEKVSSEMKTENLSDGSSSTVPFTASADVKTSQDVTKEFDAPFLNSGGKACETALETNDDGKSKKEDFFDSDTEDTDYSLSGSGQDARGLSKARGKWKVKKTETPEKEEEDELQKLLKMTEIASNKASKADEGSTIEGEEKGDKQDLTGNSKAKAEELRLIDCLGNENEENTAKDEPEEEARRTGDGNSVDMLNFEAKKVFLLSSDEDAIVPGSEVEEKKPKKKERRKKKTDVNKKEEEEEKKKRADDLRWFRWSDLSTDEAEELKSESSISCVSSDATEVLSSGKEKEKKKRGNKTDQESKESESLTECLDSSDSDIQQVYYHSQSSQSLSPSKGRKNIKKILKKESLQGETKQALKIETERRKRVSERQKLFDKLYPDGGDESKLVLDFDPETKEELVVVDARLVKKLKPHQRQGVKFMWDCCFESLKRSEEDSGSGCVLAHCMGLGKTLQVITLVHTILCNDTGVRTVMIMCPLNTIKNWLHEFKFWLGFQTDFAVPFDLTRCQSKRARAARVRTWMRKGGVMVLSYEMFRSLVKRKDAAISADFSSGFLDPGPDLVVCDEGHVLKNESTNLSKFVNLIKTLRRIVLTGTPLQNNLFEYYCMVQFVKPNILGTKKEFSNRFVNPINNGQFEDSTELDVKIMKRRSHVLHTMLDGFIQRRSYSVLTPFLPEKQEYVISISLTESQSWLYRFFIQQSTKESRSLLTDFSWLRKVWTHPRVMLKHMEKNRKNLKGSNPERSEDAWGMLLDERERDGLTGSGKLVLLFHILKKCREVGDKVLVFSQSLENLDLIEYFLQKAHKNGGEFADSWVLGADYFRMDGSTKSMDRDEYCRKFNNANDRRARLFVISTRAGGLGINLVGANRVVVFDASWNPSHDVQCIFRVYRFGQPKSCYIYRFLAEATMEEKIYKRQVTKLSLAHRILDEHQIERHYSMGNLQELYDYDPVPKESRKLPKLPKDSLFAEILVNNRDIVVGYHEHDSLLENKEDEELTEEERRAAWEEYEKERLAPPSDLPQASHLPSFDTVNPLHQINHEALQTVNSYRESIGRGTASTGWGWSLPPASHPMCKIVDVRTLQLPPGANVGSENLPPVKYPFGGGLNKTGGPRPLGGRSNS